VTYAVRRAVIVGGLITIGALFGLFASTGIRARVLDAYLVAIAAVLMLMLIRAVRTLLPERPFSPFDRALAAMREQTPPSAGLTLERDLELSRLNSFHFHMRLRPVLREIAAVRVKRRFGVELDREPGRARELVPAAAWEVVRPDRPPPDDRLAPGPTLPSLRDLVSELERL
jgi:hypothetical protein